MRQILQHIGPLFRSDKWVGLNHPHRFEISLVYRRLCVLIWNHGKAGLSSSKLGLTLLGYGLSYLSYEPSLLSYTLLAELQNVLWHTWLFVKHT